MEQLADLLNSLTTFIDSLSQLIVDSPTTYLVIFGLTALDVVFPLLPAEAAVTAAAAIAGQDRLSISGVVLAAAAGAFVGDNVAYWIGRVAGRPLVMRLLRGNMRQLDAVSEQFDKRGGMFVVIGRFIPGGRTVTALGAGAVRFSWPRFVAYDALAAVIWALQAAIPGFIGGRLFSDRPWLAIVFGFTLSAVLATSIWLIQRWRSRTRPDVAPVRPAVIGIDRASPLEPRDSNPSHEDQQGA